MKKILSLLSFLLLLNYFGNAQQKSFSPDPEVFIDELVRHMSSLGQANVAKEAAQFKIAWQQGVFDNNEKKAIRDICEDMLFKKLTVQPYFELFVSTINYYLANKIEKKVLTQWQQISKQLLSKNTREYLAFLETANKLFSENILYSSNQQKWFADNNKFEFIYDGRVAIRFKNVNLTCAAFLDKIVIYETEGVFYPDKFQWIGRNGKALWTRVGIAEEDASCKFSRYNIDMSSSSFMADSAYLRFPKYFKGDVLGRFSERISFSTNQEQIANSSFPSFTSYKGNVKIDSIVGDMAIYNGGFSLSGNQISGNNINNDPVTITLLFRKKPQVILKSKAFKIQDGVALSLRTNLTILVDSNRNIYHPSVEVRYDFVKKVLTVNKGSEGLMQMAFLDEYHNVELDVDRIIWKQNLPYIEFDNRSDDKQVFVESSDFFKDFRYEKVQGMLNYNPLARLREYSLRTRQTKFSVKDYAMQYGSNPENLKPQLIDLADDGYIFYDNENDSIEVRTRLFNYVNNYLKVRDYDVIRMSSVISAKPNVTLSLNNLDLLVEGVRKFTISDSQNCVAVPFDQKLIIKKNRDMNFGGVIRAGKVDFYSKDFNFKYNAFMVEHSHFDSMVLYYPDELSGALKKVQSVLSDLYGTIEFDYPKNKSGLKKKDHPDYPIFTSERGSKVHYEYAQTHNFMYKMDRFYFEVDPFRITNLNDFTAADLKLPGTFISDDIFPNFRHELTIQPDFSLGFVKQVSLPMYRNSGKGDLTLSLSNKGLYGSGNITYLGSKSVSNEFLLLPKETKANSETFDLPESEKYPLVSGVNVTTQWLPYAQTMKVTHNIEKFDVFKMKYKFAGTLELTPQSLNGNGELLWDEAIYYSKNMAYGKNKVQADTSGIKIFSIDPNVYAFQTSNVQSQIDFTKRVADLTANSSEDYADLTYNKYKTNLSDYKWKMDDKRIEMRPNPKFLEKTPQFISTNAAQDSLKFEAKYADFDLKENVLYIDKIPFIDIADSRLYPNKGKAIVRKDADMDRLDSCKVEANRQDKFHEIYNANIKVYGRNNIRGTGYYTYITKTETEHEIFLDSISINRQKNLVGVGYIKDSLNYTLDTKIGYKGWAKILSTEKPINYFGYVKPLIDMDYVGGQWIKFKGPMEADEVIIDVSDPRNLDDRKMLTGLFVAGDSVHVYPMIFGMKRRYSDPEITLDSGILYYDHKNGDIVIGSRKKLLENEEKGNVLRVNDKNKTIHALGQFDLSLNVKKGFKAGFGGETKWKETDTTYNFDWSFFMDFPLPSEAVSKIVELLQNPSYGRTVNINTPAFRNNLTEFYPSLKDAKPIVDRVSKSGSLSASNKIATDKFFKPKRWFRRKLKESFNPRLYIQDVEKRSPEDAQLVISSSNWHFDNYNNAFVCNGKIDIAAINGVNINKSFGGIFVIDKKRSGDDIHMYIELNANNYIYLNYVRGVMYAWSTDDKFNSIIIKQGEKISNDDYSLRRGTPRGIDKLLRRFDK